MTTFQSVIFAISQAMSEFFPIGSQAHHILLSYFVGWQAPPEALLGALHLGSFLALLIYFRHDWASMISCFLQVIIYRKRPMTLDERLPIFVAISSLPIALTSTYIHSRTIDIDWTPLKTSLIFAFSGLIVWFFDQFGRKLKGMFDWNWINAMAIGMILSTAVIPGVDPLSMVLLGALFLNYKREPAAKYAYFTLAPILLAQTLSDLRDVNFHSSAPCPELSWLSFSVAIVVTFLVGLLVIGGFMKHIQTKSLNQYILYRLTLTTAICFLYWMRK